MTPQKVSARAPGLFALVRVTMLHRHLRHAVQVLHATPIRAFTTLPIIDIAALTSLDQVSIYSLPPFLTPSPFLLELADRHPAHTQLANYIRDPQTHLHDHYALHLRFRSRHPQHAARWPSSSTARAAKPASSM